MLACVQRNLYLVLKGSLFALGRMMHLLLANPRVLRARRTRVVERLRFLPRVWVSKLPRLGIHVIPVIPLAVGGECVVEGAEGVSAAVAEMAIVPSVVEEVVAVAPEGETLPILKMPRHSLRFEQRRATLLLVHTFANAELFLTQANACLSTAA